MSHEEMRELNNSIETEIFGAVALTDAEWDMCKAAIALSSGPQHLEQMTRLIKAPLDEIDFYTKLNFRLVWPSDYANGVFNAIERLINRMRLDGWLFDICDYEDTEGRIIKTAGFQKLSIRGEAIADTDPLAVANAALLAVREWKKYVAVEEARKELVDTL